MLLMDGWNRIPHCSNGEDPPVKDSLTHKLVREL